MYKKILLSGVMLLSIPWLAAQNVGIGTATPAAKLDVQGNKIGYDVLKVSNDKDGTPDSAMVFSSNGSLGIGVPVPGSYKLVTHGLFPTAFSPQVEFWNGDPNLSASMMLADINDAGSFNGVLNLYLTGNKNVAIQALGNSYLMGGNLGIGTPTPRESLELTGAAILGPYSQPAGGEIPGTIEWNGFNFVGWTGPGQQVFLDAQPSADNDWLIQVSGYLPPVGPPPNNPELVPMMPPSSMSMSLPGDPNQGGIVWIPDKALPSSYPHQLMLESTTNLASDASMLYRMSDWSIYVPEQVPPLMIEDYSMGIFRNDVSFKLFHGTTLGPTTQGDQFTMFRAHPSGIFDLSNQSRARTAVTNIDWNSWQVIQPNQWTPVNFTNPISGIGLVRGIPWWDEHGELTVANSPGQTITNNQPNAYFTVTEDGFYQVNARCEFETDEYIDGNPPAVQPVFMRSNAYVAIAIYLDIGTGWISYAVGNQLQTTNNIQLPTPPPEYPDATETMYNNNAPNVSDIIYLQAGDRVSVWAFHWAFTPMMLRSGDNILYFSIHKIS